MAYQLPLPGGALTPGQTEVITVALTGVTSGMGGTMAPVTNPVEGGLIWGPPYSTSSGNVTFRFSNPTASNVVLAARDWKF